MKLALSLAIVATLVAPSYHQFLGIGGRLCNKQVDCQPNQNCRMHDYFNYPSMWPPCPHTGVCICSNNFVTASNGTCIPYVQLNLNDRCSNQAWEIIRTPEQRCDGTKVICNTPLFVSAQNGAFCQPVPQPTVAARPVVIVTNPPTTSCPIVSWLAACDSSRACCDTSRGLTCQTRGPTNQYQQCLCAKKDHVFDQQIGFCRPRIYGDLCTDNDDCNSGLISNVGFECRFGRCRCQQGFEPVDNNYWNETSRTNFVRRICVSSGAVTWVPTGGQCHMNPERVASSNGTRVCHLRAFCHQCYSERGSGTVGLIGAATTSETGICREYTCSSNNECGFQGTCNRWAGFVDPPCERGMCDCNWRNGFWKDRFSRCSPMRQLWLGDRCLTSPNGLHQWYPNNENWDDDKVCVPDDGRVGGYAGYTWGVIKCKLPLVEDADGNCVRNDNKQGIFYNIVGYGAACEDTDLRLPRTVCDASKGLVCRNKVCQCPISTSCSASYAGCSVSASTTSLLWDGNTCRIRGFGDACNTTQDCCGGSCTNNVCSCPSSTTPLDIGSSSIMNGGQDPSTARVTNTKFCFRNFSVVGKGQECHLDPATWNCGGLRYGHANTWLPALVCAPGLVCLRCPADFETDDETHGICREVTPLELPAGSCGLGELTENSIRGLSTSVRGGRGWSTWYNSATRFETSPVVLLAIMVLTRLF